MKIALIGYGKMGHAIETIAIEKGHEVMLKISSSNAGELTKENLKSADVAIEFTNPHNAVKNMLTCFDAGVPVVCGSTGWLKHWDEITKTCNEKNGSLLYSSNFSLGVNIFFELNKKLASLMQSHESYDVAIEEIHHTQKKDAPSGTAISLAEQIIALNPCKKKWVNEETHAKEDLQIISKRIDPAPGTHKIKYSSAIDDIEIIHTAHSRQGFAAGAVLAAEFIKNKTGIYAMEDVMKSMC